MEALLEQVARQIEVDLTKVTVVVEDPGRDEAAQRPAEDRRAGLGEQVQAALNWFVGNYVRLAEWYASVVRVVALEEALDSLDADKGE